MLSALFISMNLFQIDEKNEYLPHKLLVNKNVFNRIQPALSLNKMRFFAKPFVAFESLYHLKERKKLVLTKPKTRLQVGLVSHYLQ